MSFKEEGLQRYIEGSYSTALEIFLTVKTHPAEDPELAYYMGLCYTRLGKKDDAIRLFLQVVARESHLIRLYQSRMLLSWLFVEKNDIEKAEQQLWGILQDGFESPQAWSALGYCQWRRDQTDLALESYREALKLDEKNPNAVNGLGYLLAESGKDPFTAVELCRKAVETDPGNMAYRDSLGWALFRVGKLSEAVLYLTEALSNRPGDDIIKGHLEAVKTHEQPKNQL